MNQESMDLYIENLLQESNLNLPEDFKAPYVEKVKEQLSRRIGIVIMENLDEEGVVEFSRLMDQEPSPDMNAIQAAFTARIPDLEEKIKEALIGFAADFISAAKKSE